MKHELIISISILNVTIPVFGEVHKIVIIGGGPAAYSAGVSAGNGQLDPVIIEGVEPGGQPVKAGEIKNFPSHKSINGAELVSSMREHAEELGAKIIDAQVTKVDFKSTPFSITTEKGETFQANSVIIATGSEPIKLNCPGEDKNWGKGVIVCAKCDGHLFQDKEVAIIGGGYSALREVGNLKPFASKITIVNPEAQLSGPQFLINQAQDPKIKIIPNHQVVQILEKDGQVAGVEIENKDTKQKQVLPVAGVLVGLGWKPSSKLFEGQLTLNAEKQIVVTNDTKTSVPGVFAAGDITSRARHQLFTSAADGFSAALDAEGFLREKGLI